MAFKELPLGEVSLNPFTKLDKEWGLVAAGDAGASNAMTVSWGGMGTIWNKPVVTISILNTSRPWASWEPSLAAMAIRLPRSASHRCS